MSQKAIVAYESGDGFDLHFSMNGAEEFYLESYLHEYLDGRYDKTLSRLESRVPGGTNNRDRFTDGHSDAIASDPIVKGVPLEDIGGYVDFLDIEGLYLVRENDVETYAAVWLYPDVLRVLRDAVRLTVYTRSSFSLDREPPLSSSPELIAQLSETDFSSIGFELPEVRQFIEANHQGICQNLRWVTNDVYMEDDLEATWLVAEETVKIRPQTTHPEVPKQEGRGVFIQVDSDKEFADRGSPESVAEAGQSLRIEQSLKLVEETDTSSNNQHLNAELEILAELIRLFGTRVASFSPEPYGKYVNQYIEKLGADTTCTGLDYRLLENAPSSFRLVEHEADDVPSRDSLQNMNRTGVTRQVFNLSKDSLDSDGRTVMNRSVPGDLLIASLTDSVLTGIAFAHHSPLVVAEADVIPEGVDEEARKGDLRRQSTGGGAAGKRFVLQSPYEVLNRDSVAVGECVIVYDEENSSWDRFTSGEILESIIAGFTEFDGTPVESIAVNPPTVKYWYVCVFRFYRCGMAHNLREQLEQPYVSVVDLLTAD